MVDLTTNVTVRSSLCDNREATNGGRKTQPQELMLRIVAYGALFPKLREAYLGIIRVWYLA